jgi:hypothetical protein
VLARVPVLPRRNGCELMWRAILTETGERHALPIDDLRPHDESAGCWCRPFLDGEVLVHNAMDSREQVERGETLKQ